MAVTVGNICHMKNKHVITTNERSTNLKIVASNSKITIRNPPLIEIKINHITYLPESPFTSCPSPPSVPFLVHNRLL